MADPLFICALIVLALGVGAAWFVGAAMVARRRDRRMWQLLAEVCHDLRAVRTALDRAALSSAVAPPALPRLEALEAELARRGLVEPAPDDRRRTPA
ncbi:MAG: hypothetical protein AB7K86_15705 [Rhodospirillales bacterium]